MFRYPVWASNRTEDGRFALWQHFRGVDKVWANGVTEAVPSYFRTGDIAWCAISPDGTWTGVDRKVALDRSSGAGFGHDTRDDGQCPDPAGIMPKVL